MSELFEGVVTIVVALAVMSGAVFTALLAFHLWDKDRFKSENEDD